MISVQPEDEPLLRKDPFLVTDQVAKLVQAFHLKFERLGRAYLFFHLFFFIIGGLELISFILFFRFLNDNYLVAFALALIFLTAFSYFILRLYCQTRKPEQIKELNFHFKRAVKEVVDYKSGNRYSHLAMADIFCKLAESLNGKENTFYVPPRIISCLSAYLEQMSSWTHWQDVFDVQELSLSFAIEEQIQLVKCDATNLEAHIALANGYILLSSLYVKSRSQEDEGDRRTFLSKDHSDEAKKKFREAVERAIEEFKILSNYVPNDPWVHEQLAYSYCDLQMHKEAIAEYEMILKFNPSDPEILYKLGVLYFHLGHNAQGLQIYEQLKRCNFKKAEALIVSYGAYTTSITT